MHKLLDLALPFLFGKLPLLNKLDGYKRTLGNSLIVTAATLTALQQQFPELPFTATALLWVGLALKALGDLHADSKARRG
jgi:hypothetical protein